MPNSAQRKPEFDIEDVRYELGRATSLLEAVIHYRDVAQDVDDKFRRENEHRQLSLDDIPYGEELIRTRDLPEELEKVIDSLVRIEARMADQENIGEVVAEDVSVAFRNAREVISEARDTLDECTALPPDQENED